MKHFFHSMYKGYRMYIWKIYSLQGRINENSRRDYMTRRKYGVDVAWFQWSFPSLHSKIQRSCPQWSRFCWCQCFQWSRTIIVTVKLEFFRRMMMRYSSSIKNVSNCNVGGIACLASDSLAGQFFAGSWGSAGFDRRGRRTGRGMAHGTVRRLFHKIDRRIVCWFGQRWSSRSCRGLDHRSDQRLSQGTVLMMDIGKL